MSPVIDHQAYPLSWPEGRPRTPEWQRKHARFETTLGKARDALLAEIRRLGGRNPIISTNLMLRKDGLFYANQRQPDDSGVAVYFTYKNAQMCFACDRWRKIEDNVWAIYKTIDALRGIERWGSGDMVAQAFRGFEALPAPSQEKQWWEVLGVPWDAHQTIITESYRRLCHLYHPDKNEQGRERFEEVQRAYEQAMENM